MLRGVSMPCSVLLVLACEAVAAGVGLTLGIYYADLFRSHPLTGHFTLPTMPCLQEYFQYSDAD